MSLIPGCRIEALYGFPGSGQIGMLLYGVGMFKEKGIGILFVMIFTIIGILSIVNKDYFYLSFSLLTIGFILSNVILKDYKSKSRDSIIQVLMIISLFAMKILKIENAKLSIVMCIVISLLYIYILMNQMKIWRK